MMSGSIEWKTATEKADMKKFFSETHGYARLIYCLDKQLLQTTVRTTQTDCRNLGRLKQLSKDDIFAITDPNLARGVDYRAAEGTIGIALLVMSACESERAYVQLLGRVGRYKDPCRRFVWSNLSYVIDQKAQARLICQLR